MSDKQRVLITGSQGFIGRALTRSLGKAGYEVWGVDRSGIQDKHIVNADLLDLQKTREAITTVPPFFALIHGAALAHGQRPPPGESCLTINTKITKNVIQALGERTPRLIFFSSVAVYGEDGRRDPVYVKEELRPATEYGKSKVMCEQRILESNLEHCDILRLAPVYDESHMNDVRKRVFLPGPFSIKMRFLPPPRYSLCHVDTVVQIVTNLLARPPEGRRIFNMADPNPYDQREIASWFPGKGIPVPIGMVRPFYWLTLLLGKRGYALRCLYWKLFRSNTYALDVKSMDP